MPESRRAARSSAQADLVIANHALVMVNAASGRDHAQRPTRIIFDEGHHVFEAADSTFAAALTGQEAIELRRWIIGPEKNSRGRRRGLSARLADVASYDDAGGDAVLEDLEVAVETMARRDVLLTSELQQADQFDDEGRQTKRAIVVATKSDLPDAADNFETLKELYGEKLKLLLVSATTGDNWFGCATRLPRT